MHVYPRLQMRMHVVQNIKHQLKPCVRNALEEMVSDPGDEHPARPIESIEHKHPAYSQEKPLRREQPHCKRMHVTVRMVRIQTSEPSRVAHVGYHSEGVRTEMGHRSRQVVEVDEKPADAEHDAEPTEYCDGSWSLGHDESPLYGNLYRADSTRDNSRCEEKKPGRDRRENHYHPPPPVL